MADPVIDTHAFVKRLGEAGMPERQAEILASENMHIMTQVLATKEDWRALETMMLRRFTDVDAKLLQTQADLSDLRAEVEIRWAQLATGLVELRTQMQREFVELAAELRAEIGELRTELRSEVARLESEMAHDRAATQDALAELHEVIQEKWGQLSHDVADLRQEVQVKWGQLSQDVANLRQEVQVKWGQLSQDVANWSADMETKSAGWPNFKPTSKMTWRPCAYKWLTYKHASTLWKVEC